MHFKFQKLNLLKPKEIKPLELKARGQKVQALPTVFYREEEMEVVVTQLYAQMAKTCMKICKTSASVK